RSFALCMERCVLRYQSNCQRSQLGPTSPSNLLMSTTLRTFNGYALSFGLTIRNELDNWNMQSGSPSKLLLRSSLETPLTFYQTSSTESRTKHHCASTTRSPLPWPAENRGRSCTHS